MRDRWYDPRTGTFLTPDPQGYGDSSNLYAYCGGDPVNCSDPTGNAAHVSRSGTIRRSIVERLRPSASAAWRRV